ncbi:MFS transporter [Rhodococcus sp. IEGM 1381]|uniref:MFS transporter n=1 Tax=Rhodococcus sp. IEGM 1381 TaxID=3047085 RepID=UPI0024B7FB52|nr:MFS transporter [Rhodococcus sp. IEGM 1381]MDI9893175.1 MFS transporter [Rhodococcus sp. IEGM 1381]
MAAIDRDSEQYSSCADFVNLRHITCIAVRCSALKYWRFGAKEGGNFRMTMTSTRPSTATLGLAALAVGTFAIGTSEFVVMGMLSLLSSSLNVTVSAAGGVITAYALGVAVGAPSMIVLLNRVPRPRALLILLSLFVASHLAAAVAPSFEWLLVVRFVGGLPHGAFFGLAAVVGTSLVDPSRHGRAIAVILAGLTIANVVGVPAGTWLAQVLGWRSAFVAIAVLGAIAFAAVRFAIPDELELARPSLRQEFQGLLNRHSMLTVATVAIGFAGLFTAYAYIDPLMVEQAGLDSKYLPWVLAFVGVGFTLGTSLGGWAADRNVKVTLIGGLVVFGLFLALLPSVANSIIGMALALFFVGAAAFVAELAIQKRLIDQAPLAPTVASATSQSAFNIANALGASAGSVVISSGWSISMLGPVGAAFVLTGVIVAAYSLYIERQGIANKH